MITGAFDGGRDNYWFNRHLADFTGGDGSVTFTDMSGALCTIGVWGPRARDMVQAVCEADLSNEAFPYLTAREISIGSVPVLAMRRMPAGFTVKLPEPNGVPPLVETGLRNKPLSTLRAKIDYGFTEAATPQGNIGVQVWVNQGMYHEDETNGADAQEGQAPKKPKRTYKR